MQPTEMDSMRLWILMIAGGVFSVAGILLMFRAKQEGSSARLELFGQKFEASSTGIIVFLIGAAFLAAPVFVPERPRANPPPRPATQATSAKEPARARGRRIPPDCRRRLTTRTKPNQQHPFGGNDPQIGETVRGAALEIG